MYEINNIIIIIIIADQRCEVGCNRVTVPEIMPEQLGEGVVADRYVSRTLKGNVLGVSLPPAYLYGLNTITASENTVRGELHLEDG